MNEQCKAAVITAIKKSRIAGTVEAGFSYIENLPESYQKEDTGIIRKTFYKWMKHCYYHGGLPFCQMKD